MGRKKNNNKIEGKDKKGKASRIKRQANEPTRNDLNPVKIIKYRSSVIDIDG